MKRALLLAALGLVAASQAHAGAWAIGEGSWYAKLGVSALSTDELATPDGNVVEIPDFERRLVSFYLEYGLSAGWTAILDAPLRSDSSIEGFGSAYGPGDLVIGVQRQIRVRSPWALAVRALAQAPTGDEELGQGLLPTGSGTWESEILVSAGRSLASGSGWGYLEGGRRFRGSALTDALTYRGQAGLHLGERTTLAGNIYGVEPDGGRSVDGAGQAAGLGDGARFLAYGVEASYEVKPDWRVEFAVEDTTRARNLATGVTARLGLSLRR